MCFIILSIITNAQTNTTTYPKITGLAAILHPIATFTDDGNTVNLKDYYQVGFPMAVNIWKTPKVGFSFQIIPFIRVEGGSSKTNNLLFHPGILTALGKGFTFTGRAAFETSGRYGFTPIFSKIIKRDKYVNYYVATPLPCRFGNDRAASFSPSLEFGITF